MTGHGLCISQSGDSTDVSDILELLYGSVPRHEQEGPDAYDSADYTKA